MTGDTRGIGARVWRVLTRAREMFPLTLRGLGVLTSMSAALWFYGFSALDGVWYVAGIGLLSLCAVALVSVLAAAVRMRFALRQHAAASRPLGPSISAAPGPATLASASPRTETERPTKTSFFVPRLRFWLFVDVRLEWIEPAEVTVEERPTGSLLGEEVRLPDHGQLRRVRRRVIVRDVFGLSSIALRDERTMDLDVLPHAGALRSLPLLRSLAGGDDMPHPMGIAQGDRLELRRYAPGDPARFIHWKAYARTHKLVVRMPERALSRAHRVAAYLVAGPGDRASAAAARVALEEGAFGDDFRFGADGSPAPVDRAEAAIVAILRSSSARGEPAAGLAAFVDEVEREGPVSLILFVPSGLGGAVEHIASVIRQRARPVRVVLGIDGLLTFARRPLFTRLAFVRIQTARVSLESLRADIAAYRRLGCDVLVLDRESGRVLGEAHLKHAESDARSTREQAA